ncbi:unnamed protein product [Penicillium salamii]|uniref:Vacuolar protein sorting/targeting protein 10 n=1 Tax=Penicillium salamii TaxID=1612424 RepID=A0A9W4NRW1_9EURO|nr:unnamed protein product [Penicillium salamii]CAG8251071.1 unnamed protein product [Penicillium salamii]CAG8271882.1 unnamed protein product [Penicillium salamii]CAG8274107.1 unnamed protein product [Penicillium salamii]CAG8285660.1 unnamed protein product [Penicillium salamii]
MIPRWLLLTFSLLLAWASLAAAGNEPRVVTHKLEGPPTDLFYFKGTNTVLYRDDRLRAHVSFDGGEKWEVIKGKEGTMEGAALFIWKHPYDDDRAYILGKDGKHWITTDQAKTWKQFKVDLEFSVTSAPLEFHGWDAKKVIFMGADCSLPFCPPRAFYTTNDFQDVHPLRELTLQCMWAASRPQFGQDIEVPKSIGDRIMCVVPGLRGPFDHTVTERLIYTDNYFKDDEDGVDAKLDHGRPLSGVSAQVRSVTKYLVARVQSRGTQEQALYVSDDATVWHRAEFGSHRIEEDAYTILESTNYSIQIDVQTTMHKNRMGSLFSSNSNGTYFTKNIDHTNQDTRGIVDFERVTDIQGITIVNTVKNWEEAKKSDSTEKKLVSSISFDDGRTFQSLKADKEELHIHSMTKYFEMRKLPMPGHRMFSSPAPGLVMGVGNTGDHLKEYADGDLYVSDDAGLTWRRALKGPHRYEFGDQGGVILAASDGKTKKIQYSIDHGKEWESISLDHEVVPLYLISTPDSTSLRFLLVGISAEKGEKEFVMSFIDFDGLHERECGSGDLEEWTARLDEKGEPDCLMGQKQFFHRRKPNADCFIKKEFAIAGPEFKPCKCSAEDFECDYNFIRSEDRKECVPAVPLTAPAGACKEPTDKYMGPSGWRLIPGNACIREGGENLEKQIERSCSNSTDTAPITDGKPRAGKPHSISAKQTTHFYLERQASNTGTDETIIMLADKELYISRDHGHKWKRAVDDKIVSMVEHRYFSDAAFFITDSKKVWYTINHGESFHSFTAPSAPTKEDLRTLAFNEKKRDSLIWIGHKDCEGERCRSEAYITDKRGASWDPMLIGTGNCDFAAHEGRNGSDSLVICAQYKDEEKKNNLQLVTSDDKFSTKETPFESIADYGTKNDFVVVAHYGSADKKFMNASVSVDGRTYAEAHFPFNINVPGYTILQSSPHALFLLVATNMGEGRNFGSVVKSNSNGTYFVQSLEAVNQNDRGMADFDKMEGLEGVLVANVVINSEDVKTKGSTKKLRTVISHNDGGQWALVPPPLKDVDGKKFDCSVTEGKGTGKCAIHFHGFAERRNYRHTLYSGSAVGLMLAQGNVGDSLGPATEADTFLTNDGGISWHQVKKGPYMWEYGAAGSVIVLVAENKATNVVHYTLDEGATWNEFQFTEKEMVIHDISTVPSDTSKNFLLWGTDGGKTVTIPLDFSGIWSRDCKDDEKDYFMWTPSHPFQEENCLFGHVQEYHRKNPKAECWNAWREPHIHSIGRNCTCTRADFECDYNYEMQKDGSCGLVPGLPKPDHITQCTADPERVEYWEPTGYRRIPQTTCQGGLTLDQDVSHPCPNKEEEYNKKHGISGVGLFFAIVIPILVAVAVGWYVYTHWDGKFGQIRLGESSSSSRDALAIPVAIIAGVVAVAQAVPLLVSSLFRSAGGLFKRGQRPYATRGSFAARRGDYSHVVDDEDELLGPDEFDEEEEA